MQFKYKMKKTFFDLYYERIKESHKSLEEKLDQYSNFYDNLIKINNALFPFEEYPYFVLKTMIKISELEKAFKVNRDDTSAELQRIKKETKLIDGVVPKVNYVITDQIKTISKLRIIPKKPIVPIKIDKDELEHIKTIVKNNLF